MKKQEIDDFIRDTIQSENLIPLESVADIIFPHAATGEKAFLTEYKYPIDYDNVKVGRATNVALHKYDIVMRGRMPKLIYMVDEEPKTEICAKQSDVVIRPKSDVQPEYLFLFLKSNTGQKVMNYFANYTSCRPQLKREDFKHIYIAAPTLSEQEYRTAFEIENHYNVSYSTYNTLLANFKTKTDDGISALFNDECIEAILKNKEDAFAKLIRADVLELNTCYKAKAYKATLIIAGSILEAVLLDWLSEKDGVNYFETQYKSPKHDNLLNYINAIKELEAPRWVQEAQMAHDIRKKRNLVHAKLGIDSDEVNEETCKMVLDYLEKVISTRAGKSIN